MGSGSSAQQVSQSTFDHEDMADTLAKNHLASQQAQEQFIETETQEIEDGRTQRANKGVDPDIGRRRSRSHGEMGPEVPISMRHGRRGSERHHEPAKHGDVNVRWMEGMEREPIRHEIG